MMELLSTHIDSIPDNCYSDGDYQTESLLIDGDRPNDGVDHRIDHGRNRTRQWRNLLQKWKKTHNGPREQDEEDADEDEALLSSCSEVHYTDHIHVSRSSRDCDDTADGAGGTAASIMDDMQEPLSDCGEGDDDDNDDDNGDDEESDDSKACKVDIEEQDLIQFTPLSTGGDKGGTFQVRISSLNPSSSNKVVQSIGSTNDEDDDEDEDDEDDDDDDNDDDDDGNDDVSDCQDKDSSFMPRVSVTSMPNRISRSLPMGSGFRDYPLRTSESTQPRQSLSSRNVSEGSGYNDRQNPESSNVVVDSENRKRINGRIEGIGSLPQPPDEFRPPKTLRARLLAFREGRMKKMPIGGTSWTTKLENKMIDIVDAVLPPPPAPEKNDAANTVATPRKSSVCHASNDASQGSLEESRISRKAWNDDNTYIIYLERELKNRDLECTSWKKRALELELEVKRLKQVLDDDSSTGGVSQEQNEEEECDIEWQTEVPAVGVLIDLGASNGGGDDLNGSGIDLELFESCLPDKSPGDAVGENLIQFGDFGKAIASNEGSHHNHDSIANVGTVWPDNS